MGRKTFFVASALALVTFMLLYMPVPAQSQGKAIELSYSDYFPPEFGIAKSSDAWAREIEKRSSGRVKITIYHGGTLTSSNKCYEGVVKGLSDIGQSVLSYTAGRFPLMEVVDLPCYTHHNNHLPTRIADDMWRKFQPKELSDVHVLYMHGAMLNMFYTANKPVRRLEDFKGLRIRSTGSSAKLIEYLGATPVGISKADEYEAMQKGVVDGTIGAPASLKGWRIADVSKYSACVPRAGYTNAQFVVINKKKWESLPPDIQKIFTEVSQEWVEKTADVWNAIDIESAEYGKKMGHQFIVPDEKEAARWERVLQPMFDEYVKRMESKGLPGKAALEYRRQLMEKYSKMYPPLKFK